MTPVWSSLIISYFDLKEVFGRPSSAFSLLFSTCMSLVIIAMVLSGTGDHFNDRLAYLFPGILGLQCLICLSSVSSKIQADRGNGTFVLMLLSPSNSQSLVIGHLCGAIVRVLVQASVLFFVVSLFLKEPASRSGVGGLVAIWAIIMGTVFFGSLGVILRVLFAGLSQLFVTILMSAGTISSTAYFTIDTVPAKLRSIAKVNPVSFLCDSIRCGLRADTTSIDWRPVAILTILAVVAFFLALASTRILDRQTEGA